MKCPDCQYEFDPTRGLQCPRCGETLDCSAVTCDDCNACGGGVFGSVRQVVRSARSDDE